MADRLVAIVAAADPLAGKAELTPSDFSKHRYTTDGLFPDDGWEYGRFVQSGACYPADIMKAESTRLILSLVAQGHGISILPMVSVQTSLDSAKVRTIPLANSPITF
jgi:DNA-binding transcriptional LysR family regulator